MMNRTIRCILCLFVAFAASIARAQSKAKNGPDVLVVADNFGNDVAALRPTADNPVHYVLLGGMQWDLGSSVAGEKMPPVSELESLIHRTLKSQGYTPTKIGGPMPDIVILYGYGSAHLEVEEWIEDSMDSETGEVSSNFQSMDLNAREIYGLAGAAKIKGKVLSSAIADEMTDAIENGRLYISISALDAPALRTKKKQMVWRTRISIPTRRNRLPDAMEIMLTSAAPYFGADSALPVVIGDEDRRKTDVQIGESTVVGDPE